MPNPVMTAPTVMTGTAVVAYTTHQTDRGQPVLNGQQGPRACGRESRAKATEPSAVARDMTALMPPIVAVDLTPTSVRTNDNCTISA